MGEVLDRETLEMALDTLRDFAKQRLTPELLLDFDARDEMPIEIVREMCSPEVGLQLLLLPGEFGGMGGAAFDVYRFCEELARIDVGVATGLLATFLGSDPILVGGTPDQKKKWLCRIAEEGILVAYGATEPEAGSDLAALRTTATPIEEGGLVVGYRLNGRKQWISNGGVAELFTVLALAPGGPSWFIVERGAPGFSHERPEDKHGIRLSNTAALVLEDVRVDSDRLVGGVEGQGLVQALSVFGYTRLMVAAFGLGAGWAALDIAIAYSKEREQGGAPLSEKQGYTHKLIVPHAARLEAARACIEETADRIDAGEGSLTTEGAIAKYLATEAGNQAADASIQALGGYGYTREYMVEKIRRDVRITTIYEGTSEIMEMTVSRDRWQVHLKTRGTHYHDRARELEQLAAKDPACGADTAALAHHALAEVMERARLGRLTRSQHLLLRLGEWITWTECSGALARRAASAATGTLSDKAFDRFDASALGALSRVFARETARKVASEGLAAVVGAAVAGSTGVAELEGALGLPAIHAAQAGLLADMDAVAAALYERRI